eukprot:1143521-Pelagomonas_calceolata.AAC.1
MNNPIFACCKAAFKHSASGKLSAVPCPARLSSLVRAPTRNPSPTHTPHWWDSQIFDANPVEEELAAAEAGRQRNKFSRVSDSAVTSGPR